MSRIISTETPGRKRASIFKLIVSLMPAIRAEKVTTEARNDIVAFIVLSLDEVDKSVQGTLAPWEKRGYWSKADHFRMEWEWVSQVRESIIKEETPAGWQKWPEALVKVFVHLADIKQPRKKMGRFWEGSYMLYKKQK